MMKWIQRQLVPVARFFGRVAMPWTVKQLDGDEYEDILQKALPGDIFLTRTYGHLSTMLIPGYWKHAAILTPSRKVAEAIGAGVQITDLVSFVTSKDELVLLRPTFCGETAALEAAAFAAKQAGAEYDYEFSLGNKAFYCAELVFVAYRSVMHADWEFTPRERLGIETITADDFYEAKKWWQVIYDSRGNHG